MKKRWITYDENWRSSPMSYWVHIEADGRPWHAASRFEPPLPSPVPGKGFPRFHVEFNGCTFEFASLDELRACIATLGQKLLPTTIRLARDRGGDMGPNSHWLSWLPPKAKPWRYRQPAVAYLEKSLAWFEENCGTDQPRA